MTKFAPLDVEAPGLLATLRRAFDAHVVTLIANDYRVVCAAAGRVEAPVVRDDGASYNPRPARIAAIILAEGPPYDSQAVRLALWSTVPMAHREQHYGDLPSDSKQEIQALWSLLVELEGAEAATAENVVSKLASNTRVIEALLAVQLDTVRHLHMTNLPVSMKQAALSTAEGILQSLCGRMPDASSSIQSLLKKLQHATSQQTRILIAL